MQTKVYAEQFRDQLKKYEQMQEWKAHYEKITIEERALRNLDVIDKVNVLAEIHFKDVALAAEPHTIPGAPIVAPGVAPMPTNIPNPARQTLLNEKSLLEQELRRINTEIGTQTRVITTLQ